MPKPLLYVTNLFLIAVIIISFPACKKNTITETQKTFNSSGLVRFKDQVFSESQIFTQFDFLYRDSLLHYAPLDSMKENLRYDFFCPNFDVDTMPKRPLLIWIHGGSGYIGDKVTDRPVGIDMARYGFAVITMNYRLNPWLPIRKADNTLTQKELYETIYRQVQDIRFLIRHAKHKASTDPVPRVDTNLVFIAGLSQGGIISLNAAYFDDSEVNPIIDQTVLGILDHGPSFFNGIHSKVNAVASFAGAIVDMSIIQPNDVPAILIHSTGDNVVPIDCGLESAFRLIEVCGGRAVANRLTELGIPNALKVFNDPFMPSPPALYTHGNVVLNPQNPFSGDLNPDGVRFMMENLFYGFLNQ